MGPPNLRSLAVVALAVLLCGSLTTPAPAKWSHPAVPHAQNGNSPSVTTTTTNSTKVPGKTTTSKGPAPASFYDTITSGGPARVSIVSTTPGKTSTTTTSVARNADGSTTTTVTTVTTANGPSSVTTTLTNPPKTIFSVQTVTQNPPTTSGGVTTTTITIVQTLFRPITTVETLSTVAVTAVAPVTTTTTTTTTPTPVSASRSTTPGTTQPPPLLAASGPGDIEAAVASLSAGAQQSIEACQADTPPCIADQLDAYAEALRKLAPYLPPQLRTLPTIVANAAKKVRAAKPKAEAVQAVKTAIVEVHKRIALLRADDADTRQGGTREGTLVAETLQVASDKLERAVGL